MGNNLSIRLASRGAPLPLDAVTQTFGFIGKRGSGKTYGAGVLVEGLLDMGAQTIVLDPVGNWYGLRISGSGTRARAYDIPVLGGEHGDIPLEVRGGTLVADLIIDKHTSAVLDLSSFRKNERKQFVADFAERLYHRKKTARSPLHIVLEEAQAFAPQRSSGQERMLGAIEDIVRLGRNYGLGATLISQRPQSVNKEVLNQVEALVVFQVNGAHERKAIEQWVVHQGIDVRAMVDELPSLSVGEAFLWSPSWLNELRKVKVGKKRSADTSATPMFSAATHKRIKAGKVPGVRVSKPRALNKTDLDALQKAMVETVERAKKNDPKALRNRIALLERQLASQQPPEPVIETVEVPVLPKGEIVCLQNEIVKIRDTAEALMNAAAPLQAALDRAVRSTFPATQKQTPLQRYAKNEAAAWRGTKRSSDQPKASGEEKLRKGAVRMLQVLAAFYPGQMTKRQIAGAAKMKSTGGTFNSYWSNLRTRGLIEESHDKLWGITRTGIDYLGGDFPAVPDTREGRIKFWSERLRKGERRILREIAEYEPIAKETIAENVEMTASGGTFSSYLSVLRANNLITRNSDGLYTLTDYMVGGGL